MICHRCPCHVDHADGSRTCGEDGRSVIDHVKEVQCPIRRFEASRTEDDLAAAGYGPGHPDFPGNSDCCGGGKTK
jgi:hypothetical protein